MVDIAKSYVNETLRKFGATHVAEDARELFLDKLKDYADELSKKTNMCIEIRKGKKVLKKDVELALENF